MPLSREWFDASVLVKLGFVGFALILLYFHKNQVQVTTKQNLAVHQKLFHIILWPTVIALSLTTLQIVTNNVELALLFPWRLSSWLVPLSVSLLVGWGVYWLFEGFQLAQYPYVGDCRQFHCDHHFRGRRGSQIPNILGKKKSSR